MSFNQCVRRGDRYINQSRPHDSIDRYLHSPSGITFRCLYFANSFVSNLSLAVPDTLKTNPRMRSSTLLTIVFCGLAAASPVEHLLYRQNGTTCGRNTYSSSEVSKAASTACEFVKSGDTAGSSSYPHKFK